MRDAHENLLALVEHAKADAPKNRAILVALVGEEGVDRIEAEIDAEHARQREACPIRRRLAAVERELAVRKAT
jgi:hypothetical protein